MEVWLGATLDVARALTSMPAASFTAAEGGVILRSQVADLPRAARDLAGLGIRVIVRQPAELRDELRHLALALARDAGWAGEPRASGD